MARSGLRCGKVFELLIRCAYASVSVVDAGLGSPLHDELLTEHGSGHESRCGRSEKCPGSPSSASDMCLLLLACSFVLLPRRGDSILIPRSKRPSTWVQPSPFENENSPTLARSLPSASESATELTWARKTGSLGTVPGGRVTDTSMLTLATYMHQPALTER